jgi:ActR/RegA family two-component response regulator
MQKRGFAPTLVNSVDEADAVMRGSPTGLAVLDLPHNFESMRNAVDTIRIGHARVKIAIVNNLRDSDLAEAASGMDSPPIILPAHPKPEDISVMLNTLENPH